MLLSTPKRRSKGRRKATHSAWETRRGTVEMYNSDEIMEISQFMTKLKSEEKRSVVNVCIWLVVKIVKYLVLLPIWLLWKVSISLVSTLVIYILVVILFYYFLNMFSR